MITKREKRLLWLRDARQQSIQILKADTFWLRLRGLLGRKKLSETEGLLLEPCNNVHTIGMHFPIDIVFLAKDDRVVAVYSNIPPGRMVIRAKNACRVLELTAGMAKHLPCFPGERLLFINAENH